jgi:hypothetical protein
MSQVSKQKTVLHEIFWSLLRDGHINDVNQIVDLVNFFDKGRILAMQPPFILSHVARILEGKTCLFLQSVKSDYRLLSEEPALSARLTPTVKVRDPLARIEFLKNWTVKSSPDLSYQVTGASPNQRFKQVYLGQRKDLYYSDSGQIRKIPWENGYTQFDQLCNPKFMGEAGWRLMNEAELDWLIRKQWLFLIEEGMTESDFVIVSSEIFGTRTVKNLKVGTRSEPSVPSYGSTNPVYSKYFCVRQIESKQ